MTNRIPATIGSATRHAIIGFVLTCAAMAGIQAGAQVIAGHNSDAPVNYAADRIELQDKQNRVLLSGNVDITQAGLELRAARTIINYTDDGALKIQRIMATGGVTVTRGTERASGDVAVYDFNRRIITMAGNVQLSRGTDVLTGGRLVIDLRNGVSSVDGSAKAAAPVTDTATPAGDNGRVSGSFSVPKDSGSN